MLNYYYIVVFEYIILMSVCIIDKYLYNIVYTMYKKKKHYLFKQTLLNFLIEKSYLKCLKQNFRATEYINKINGWFKI